MDAIVANWTQKRTPEEIVAICEAAGVPSGPVLEVNQAVPHPQTLAREMVIERSGPGFPVVRITGSPLKLSETPWHIGRTPPFLGEHNEEMLCGLLGYSPEVVQKLAEKRVILPPGSPPSESEAE
ncbi:MAG: CoA transferase [Chloroflexi bacterium]|nr:CoA transferase [Chloroflexota bacterium]